MGSGIFIPSLLSIATSTSEAIIFGQQNPNSRGRLNANGPWTPPQYSQPALTSITVPASSSGTSGQQSSDTSYVFDAVFRVLHRRSTRKTSHPVLTSANISDHAYIEPSRISLEIGMSEAMSSFAKGVWVGSSTKSISAWQILKTLQINKTLLTLTTRLDVYYQMLIVEASTTDDNRTRHALKATVVLEEQLSAGVASGVASSARPQTSGGTTGGSLQSTPVGPSQLQQNAIPSPLYPNATLDPNVSGAGTVSGNSLSQQPVPHGS